MELALRAIDGIIEEELARSKAPGFAARLVNQDEVVYRKDIGLANVELNVPVDESTVFCWGSVSKLFTCIGLFQLWEQGRFRLDDPVNKYLRNGTIRRKQASWPEITFEHLLTHKSGIGELRRFADVFRPGFRLLVMSDDKPVPPMESFHELPQHAQSPAGQKYAYSNIGGSILGYITALLSGKRFESYMNDHVLAPLGMNHSDFIKGPGVAAHLASGYKYDKKKDKLFPAKPWNNIIKPSGGLNATIDDMTRFARCLLRRGELDGTPILQPATLDMIWEPRYWAHEAFRETEAIGYIFHVSRLKGHRIIWHTGGLNGFTATFDVLPEMNVAFMTVTNLGEGLVDRVTLRVRNRVLKLLTGASRGASMAGSPPDTSWWPRLTGYYGPYPGWLANTRILVGGVDFKVVERSGHLKFSSLFGPLKYGVVLFPTSNPLVYQYPVLDDGKSLDHDIKIGFTPDARTGKIAELGMDLHVLRKNPLVNTFRFKLVAGILAFAVITSIAVVVMLLP